MRTKKGLTEAERKRIAARAKRRKVLATLPQKVRDAIKGVASENSEYHVREA